MRADERTVLLTAQWRTANAVVAVDLPTGAVTPLTPALPAHAPPAGAAAPLHSYSLVGVQGGRLLALRVGPFSPPELVVAPAPAFSSGGQREASGPPTLGQPPHEGLPGRVTVASPAIAPRPHVAWEEEGATRWPVPRVAVACAGAAPPAPLAWQAVRGVSPELPAVVAEHLGRLAAEVQHVTPTVGDTSQQFESLVLSQAGEAALWARRSVALTCSQGRAM